MSYRNADAKRSHFRASGAITFPSSSLATLSPFPCSAQCLLAPMANASLTSPSTLTTRSRRWTTWSHPLVSAIFFFLLLYETGPASGLHLQGTYSTGEFFRFLGKFGFQKTEVTDRNSSFGFLFGNITLHVGDQGDQKGRDEDVHATLSVLDRGYFLEYYGNRSLFDKHRACVKMFDRVSRGAFDAECNVDGEEDFLRTVPCPEDELCAEEDNPLNVVAGNQLTYRIQDMMQSRFWYVSLVSCFRNVTTCQWEPTTGDIQIDYDLWLVNGNPEGTNKNPFRYQYSYDIQDLFGVFLLLLLIYTILIPVQFYANLRQRHPITRLLLAGLVVELAALLASNLHHLLFAFNGRGLPWLETIGDMVEIFSQSLFMLLLLLLAMGWAVTRQELKCKVAIFTLWLTYSIVHCLLYGWKKFEVDVIEDVEEFQTLPGVAILILRIVVMVCFLLSLRDTMAHEYNHERLNFFLHFGAASLVWFIYLPLMAVVALQISALWRTKFITGISYSADTFAYVVLMHLLWPSRSEQYFLLAAQYDPTDELEELCEAANHVQDSKNSLAHQRPKVITTTPGLKKSHLKKADRNDTSSSNGISHGDPEGGGTLTLTEGKQRGIEGNIPEPETQSTAIQEKMSHESEVDEAITTSPEAASDLQLRSREASEPLIDI